MRRSGELTQQDFRILLVFLCKDEGALAGPYCPFERMLEATELATHNIASRAQTYKHRSTRGLKDVISKTTKLPVYYMRRLLCPNTLCIYTLDISILRR